MPPSRWKQIEELYYAALEREPKERDSFVDTACSEDFELRRELGSLLAQNTAEEGVLDRPAIEGIPSVLGTTLPGWMSGTQLGSYLIQDFLGAGGMGEVYRAKDTKLDREVAIKVLPSDLARDPERLKRFEREAKILAALNHPNIAQLYGIEESNGVRAMVMELVPGETLKGPFPMETALYYARQIAEALEAAHEKGITHRDLKPANIMITPEGGVKVLDFGLALITQGPAAQEVNPTASPTLNVAATQAGAIMGTAAYVSPEQAAGKPVDRRADIWSYGVILWEMLTGRSLFGAETISGTLANVTMTEIQFSDLPARTPPAIRQLLRRCLDKDVKSRLQWIGEARIAIDKEQQELGTDATEVSPGRRRLRQWAAAAGMLLFVAATTSWIEYRPPPHAELKPMVRLEIDLGSEVSLGSLRGADAILSPDGTRLVYVSKGKLFTRRLDQSTATELPATEGAYAPFFSPDGQSVAFFTLGKLNKISVEGGVPSVLCDAPLGVGGSWGKDGNIIASLSSVGPLSWVPATGGAPLQATDLVPGEVTQRWPQLLPGNQAVLFTSTTDVNGYEWADIELLSLKNHARKTLQRGGTFARYFATSKNAGHLVYLHNGTMFAVGFGLDTLEVRGTPVPVLEQVAYDPTNGSARFDFSGAPSGPGMLAYRRGRADVGLVNVQWMESNGKMTSLLAKPGNYRRPSLSPDSHRLAIEILEGSKRDIWIYDWQRDTMTRLTFDALQGSANSVWTPDSRYIVYRGEGGLFWVRSDGAGLPQRLTQTKNLQYPTSFTADGKRLAWSQLTNGHYTAWTMPIDIDGAGLRGGTPELLLQDSHAQRLQPMFSPDRHWLAYTSNESGSYQVYVRAFPEKGGQRQISVAGGWFPVWSRTGHKLFFQSLDNRIMVASIEVNGDSIVAENPRFWSEKLGAYSGNSIYDLTPDGNRVAALMPSESPEAQQAQRHLMILLNFADELQQRVPLYNN